MTNCVLKVETQYLSKLCYNFGLRCIGTVKISICYVDIRLRFGCQSCSNWCYSNQKFNLAGMNQPGYFGLLK